MQFTSKNPQYEYLRQKWTNKHKNLHDSLWVKHGKALKQLAAGSIGGLMLMSASPIPMISGNENFTHSRDDALKDYDRNVLLASELKDKLPAEVKALEPSEEAQILDVISKNFDLKVTSELNGIRLNRNYGLIGGEQHLYRYPGDNLYAHADTSSDWAMYGGAGIAPNLGAWGYFAPSKEEFREKDKLRERYYLAIQTFLVPGYVENVDKYRDFFKFRKMLVVNPKTGQAIVAVIGDAGPAEFTGKHLGGSPEVMEVLGFADGPRKGAVLYFFIDDPEDQTPLGPVNVTLRQT